MLHNKRKRELLEVLGLTSDANEEEIKRAYKKMAIALHPDRNNGDKEKAQAFQKMNEGKFRCIFFNIHIHFSSI